MSVGSTVALSGVISVMASSTGVNPIIAMLSGAAVGYAVGLINGFFTAKTKLPAFIATGLNTVERFIVGSVTDAIVRSAKCDVLVIRTPE